MLYKINIENMKIKYAPKSESLWQVTWCCMWKIPHLTSWTGCNPNTSAQKYIKLPSDFVGKIYVKHKFGGWGDSSVGRVLVL